MTKKADSPDTGSIHISDVMREMDTLDRWMRRKTFVIHPEGIITYRLKRADAIGIAESLNAIVPTGLPPITVEIDQATCLKSSAKQYAQLTFPVEVVINPHFQRDLYTREHTLRQEASAATERATANIAAESRSR